MKSLVAACALALSAGLLVAVPVATASPAGATTAPAPALTGGAGWGSDTYNQASGSGENYAVPMIAGRGEIPADAVITKVDSGGANTACLIADGRGYCWATGYWGNLGYGGNDDSALPVAVDTTGVLLGKTLVDIAASSDTSCGLASDGFIACWGSDANGELGNGGAATNTNVPVAVDLSGALSGKTVVDISASNGAFCAVTSDGGAYCWGAGRNGGLGNGGTANQNVPTAVDMTNLGGDTFVSVSSGYNSFCGITAAHAAYCWGRNADGELGTGNNVEQRIPAAVVTNSALGTDVASIDSGWGTTCATRTNGEAACWGSNSYGQFGDGTTSSSSSPVAVPTFAGRNGRSITDIQPIDGTVCLIVADTDTFCSGYGGYGTLGTGSYDDVLSFTPVLDVATTLNGAHLTSLTSQDYNICATADTGAMFCWGWNSNGYGARGSWANGTAYATSLVNGNLSAGEHYTQLSPGLEYSCGLTNLARVWCWGYNGYGQLGDGTTDDRYGAVLAGGVIAGKTIVRVDAGDSATCVLDDQGEVYCVGSGSTGTLGDGARADSLTWVQPDFSAVPAGRTITAITVGEAAACALDSAGAAYCWGANGYGQMGVGSNNDLSVPTPVDTTGVLAGKVLTSIELDYESTCALDTAGAAYCWGRDQGGQLGNGVLADVNIPTAVDMSTLPSGSVFTQVDSGEASTCGVITGGALYCWGSNGSGQLGDGTTVDSNLPTLAGGAGSMVGATIVDVSVGYYGACALDSAGVVYCWGYNDIGQSAQGNLDENDTPAPIVLEGTTVEGAKFADVEASGLQGLVLAVVAESNTVPSAPTSAAVGARSNGRAVVSWGVPDNEGGSAIGSYVVEFSTSGSGPWSVPTGCGSVGAGLTCTVTGLNQRANYVFRVAAVNDTGQGAWARVWLKRTPSVVIEGRRSDKKASVVIVSGVASGLMSKPVTVRVKARGQSSYTSFEAGRVDAAGRFAWSGPALGRTFVSVVIAGTRSNRVTIGG